MRVEVTQQALCRAFGRAVTRHRVNAADDEKNRHVAAPPRMRVPRGYTATPTADTTHRKPRAVFDSQGVVEFGCAAPRPPRSRRRRGSRADESEKEGHGRSVTVFRSAFPLVFCYRADYRRTPARHRTGVIRLKSPVIVCSPRVVIFRDRSKEVARDQERAFARWSIALLTADYSDRCTSPYTRSFYMNFTVKTEFA
ncbi:hypothetical protein EVAR_50127_1 [Eumeta japonica]|uniref:Uncharacterized protein n=1 Tax=Eumeta variegata TaxID=151549 RepID=A0A4C1YTI5_EUMVA|nr:hypothetical protein EVAR_50127_1 [Eumeta japonica]